MVLKIRPRAKSFLPLVPDLTRVLTGFDRFLAFYQTKLVPDSRLNQSNRSVWSDF